MGGNRFLRYGGEGEGEMPRQIFMKVDQQDGESIFFDAVDANWFRQAAEGGMNFNRWRELADEAPIYIVESPGYGYRHDFFKFLLSLSEKDEDVPEPDVWFEMTIRSGEDALLFQNLFGGGQPIGIELFRRHRPPPPMPWTRPFRSTHISATKQRSRRS